MLTTLKWSASGYKSLNANDRFQIQDPTAKLAGAIDTEPPAVYIRIDNEIRSDR